MRLQSLLSALCAIVVLCFVLPGIAQAADPVLMRYSWQQGEVHRFRMTQHSVSKVKGFAGGKGEAQTTQTQLSTVRIDIEKVNDDGSAEAKWTVEKNRVEMRQSIGTPMIMDSENPDDRNNPNSVFAFAMVDKAIPFHVTAAGKISDVRGVEEIKNALMDSLKDEPGLDQIKESLDQGFSNQALQDQMERTLDNLPEKEVSVGDSWPRVSSMKMPQLGEIRTEEDCKLIAIRDVRGAQHVEVRADAKITPVDQTDDSPAKLIDAKSTHDLVFNLTAGQLVSYRIESILELTNSLPPEQGGDSLTAVITTTTSLTRLDPTNDEAPQPQN